MDQSFLFHRSANSLEFSTAVRMAPQHSISRHRHKSLRRMQSIEIDAWHNESLCLLRFFIVLVAVVVRLGCSSHKDWSRHRRHSLHLWEEYKYGIEFSSSFLLSSQPWTSKLRVSTHFVLHFLLFPIWTTVTPWLYVRLPWLYSMSFQWRFFS